ncbi:MAG: hypothetical protein KGH75_02205 [Rhodospirillales bacterium]|nr:hypothetical protein [Rhodospirillales bacterium]
MIMGRLFLSVAVLSGVLLPFGAVAAALNQSPDAAMQFQKDAPLIIAKLQNTVAAQQAEITALQNAVGQDTNNPKVIFSTAISANIPTGG